MTSRVLQLIFGIIFFLCSMPGGMAKIATPQEPRAVCFISEDISQGDDKGNVAEAAFAAFDEAVLADGDASDTFSSRTNGAKKVKSHHKRLNNNHSTGKSARTCLSCRLSLHSGAKELSRHPLCGDAQQERTATIRFLHLAAVIC